MLRFGSLCTLIVHVCCAQTRCTKTENLISTIWNLSISRVQNLRDGLVYFFSFLLFSVSLWLVYFITPWLYERFWHGLLFNFKVCTFLHSRNWLRPAHDRSIPAGTVELISILSNVFACVVFDTKFIRLWKYFFLRCRRRRRFWFSLVVAQMDFRCYCRGDCGIRINS